MEDKLILEQLMQRKQELLMLKGKIERTRAAAVISDDCPEDKSADPNTENHDKESPKFDTDFILHTSRATDVISEDCSEGKSVTIIENSDNESPKFIEKSYLHRSASARNSSLNSTDTVNETIASDNLRKQRKSIVVPNSSDSSDILSTSTICLERSHPFFNDSTTDESLHVPANDQSSTPEPSTKRSKIEILSVEIIAKPTLNIPAAGAASTCANELPEPTFPTTKLLELPTSSCVNLMTSNLPDSPEIDTAGFFLPDLYNTEITELQPPALSNNEVLVIEDTSKPSKLNIKKSLMRQCKKTLPKVKKEHIDFISDDEFLVEFAEDEDFSSGSSELWSGKESDLLSDSTDITNRREKRRTPNKKKKLKKECKKGIEFKKKKPVNQRKVRKTKREKGDSYETKSGKSIEAKEMKPNPCVPGKCPRNCFDIPDERRQSIFNYFWNLNFQRKKDWLIHCSSRVPVKRPKSDIVTKRYWTYEYFINEGEGRRQVCQKFLLDTLDIRQTYLLYTLSHVEEGISQEEKRHKSVTPKYDETVIASTKSYIESLPFLPSHYCRKETNKLYLPQEFKNVTNLYRLYRKYCEEKQQNYLNERKFKDFFKTEYSNISVHVPKKDKCKICSKKENNMKEGEVAIDSEYDQHIDEKNATYERFSSHQNMLQFGQSNDTVVASFDLQKILNTPHGDNILLFYSRKYTVFNFTVYESSTQNGFCFTWGESDGKRGAKEIGTCIYKYLQHTDEKGVKKVLFYCDSCGGQNRNKTILSIFQYFLTVSKNIEVIQINFLLPGHSYMPVDSMHSVIEKEVRKLTVWSPTQWPSFMESARKNPRPYHVTTLEHKDFIDWDPVTQECFPPNMKNLQMSKIRIATIKKKNIKMIKTKHSMKIDAFTHELEHVEREKKIVETAKYKKNKLKGKGRGKKSVKTIEDSTQQPIPTGIGRCVESFETRIKNIFLEPLYKKKLPISTAKYKDLKKLCDDGVIPTRYQKDFLNLPYEKNVIDTMDTCTDEEEEND